MDDVTSAQKKEKLRILRKFVPREWRKEEEFLVDVWMDVDARNLGSRLRS
jgi:hypothetical protein